MPSARSSQFIKMRIEQIIQACLHKRAMGKVSCTWQVTPAAKSRKTFMLACHERLRALLPLRSSCGPIFFPALDHLVNFAGGILQQSWQSQILELEARLAESEAKWKLVIGHHPVRNQHAPQNTVELMQHLEPILEAQVIPPFFQQYGNSNVHIKKVSVSGGIFEAWGCLGLQCFCLLSPQTAYIVLLHHFFEDFLCPSISWQS